jgi:hypothetical protein
MPQPPPGRPGQKPASVVRPSPAAPAKAAGAPPSRQVPAAPASASRPASPGTARVQSQAPAAKPSGETRRVQPLAKPATQAVAPVPASPVPGVPASSKNLRPSKMQAALADAANKKPETAGKKRAKFWFNIFIYLSIPLSLAVIGYGFWKKGAKKLVKDIGGTVTGGEEKEKPKPQVTDHEKLLEEAKDKYANAAKQAIQQSQYAKNDDEKRELLTKAKMLAEKYIEETEKILINYAGNADIGKHADTQTSNSQVLKEARRLLLELAPKEEDKKGEPNTRALGTLAQWKATDLKFVNIFLNKELAPRSALMTAAEFEGTSIGRRCRPSPMRPDRMMELLTGDLREMINKMTEDEKKAKQEELAGPIKVFEGQKFAEEDISYTTYIQGYFWKDTIAKYQVRVHEDRGVEAYQEYAGHVFAAYGKPQFAKERVGGMPEEHRLLWLSDEVVYEFHAIGNKSGMDLTIIAYNLAAWKELQGTVGNMDPFKQNDLEPYVEKPPEEPPK